MLTGSAEKPVASANWLNLRKALGSSKRQYRSTTETSRKRRKIESTIEAGTSLGSVVAPNAEHPNVAKGLESAEKGGALKATLRQMVLGHLELTENQKESGKYLAVDCEMVGIGIDGSESSLARVSVVNFHGAVILDKFVRQKERVVDYRTQWSGIREKDMIKAKPFEEVQQKVAALIQAKILIGHAVHNDLKALLLSHPWPATRDTQYYAHKHGLTKTNRPALRNLVKQELGLTIQSGEHSSVTDARATMAIYRLHKQEWEKGTRPPTTKASQPEEGSPTRSDTSGSSRKKRSVQQPSRSTSKARDSKATSSETGRGGRKGVSSGLPTIVKRSGVKSTQVQHRSVAVPKSGAKTGKDWWKELPGGG